MWLRWGSIPVSHMYVPQGREREAYESRSSLRIQTMKVLPLSDLNLFESASSTRVGKRPTRCQTKCGATIERHLESENRWQQHRFSVLLRWGDKEISRVSSLSASSLAIAAQIQSLWLNADDRTCTCTWQAPLLDWPTMGCHPIPSIKKEPTMSA